MEYAFAFCLLMMAFLRIWESAKSHKKSKRHLFNPPAFPSHRREEEIPLNDTFHQNLLITIQYTHNITALIPDNIPIKYNRVLRTINPLWNGVPFYRFTEHEVFSLDSASSYLPLLTESIKAKQSATGLQAPTTIKGRILRFETGITTCDGVACFTSEYFVDENDIPPIDTWFYHTPRYLYCWIPATFTTIMQQAIDVEILDSYLWLDQYKPEINARIMAQLATLNTNA